MALARRGARAGRRLTPEEEEIFNAGERLIPGVSMGVAEVVRHRSSYLFFRRVLEADRERDVWRDSVSVADLGCGVGHGCALLAEIPGARVVGYDNSRTTLAYAESHYAAPNVDYELADLPDLVPRLPMFDYVVSRGSLEHVDDGIELARQVPRRLRLIFDVPYGEARGVNPHHRVHDVREDAFRDFPNSELFFQDLWGVVYDEVTKPRQPNMIVCISSADGLPAAAEGFTFPLPAWRPASPGDRLRFLQERGIVLGGRAKRRLTRVLQR